MLSVTFDPGVLVEPVDDPSDPDYVNGYRVYAAWGIQRSSATELDPNTMYSPRRETPDYPFWVPSMLTSYLANLPDRQAKEFRPATIQALFQAKELLPANR